MRTVPEQVATWLVILCAVAYLGDGAIELEQWIANGARFDVQTESYTTATVDSARVFITNTDRMTAASVCVRVVVTNEATNKNTTSIAGCSGEMKPRTTTRIEVPLHPQEVREICSADGEFSWSACKISTERVAR